MFINNWYAACIAERLGADPLRVRMLDCDFVLFRDTTGSIRCLSDLCCHRGASLGAGKWAIAQRPRPGTEVAVAEQQHIGSG